MTSAQEVAVLSPRPYTEHPYTEHWVRRGSHRLYAREYPGDGPAIVLMHGFPDNLHLYDRLVPRLAGRRVVTFDFLGWGASDKPKGYPYTFRNQLLDLDAVIEQLGLAEVVLVPHDASGPAAIGWATQHPGRVAGLVLLNCFYDEAPDTFHPEAIFLNTWWATKPLARALERLSPAMVRAVHARQVGSFFRDAETRRAVLPFFTQQFLGKNNTSEPLFRLLDDHFSSLRARSASLPALKAFRRPVRLIFGAHDPYCNPGVARDLHELFPTSDYVNLPGAGHYVQLDEPRRVAELISSLPSPDEARVDEVRASRPLPALNTRRVRTSALLGRYAAHWARLARGRLRDQAGA